MTENHPWDTWNTLPDGKEGEYLTDRLTEETLRYLQKVNDQPFFLCLWHCAVHTHFQAKEEMIEKYRSKIPDTLR
jgi:hypothetical protein